MTEVTPALQVRDLRVELAASGTDRQGRQLDGRSRARCSGSSASRAAARRRRRWPRSATHGRARASPRGSVRSAAATSCALSARRECAIARAARVVRATGARPRQSIRRSASATGWARYCARTSPARRPRRATSRDGLRARRAARRRRRSGGATSTSSPAGRQQRVAIATAFVGEAAARHARRADDGPRRDHAGAQSSRRSLGCSSESGVAMVYVSHDLSVVGEGRRPHRGACTPGASSRRGRPPRCWRRPAPPVHARPDRVRARSRRGRAGSRHARASPSASATRTARLRVRAALRPARRPLRCRGAGHARAGRGPRTRCAASSGSDTPPLGSSRRSPR